MPEHDEYEYDLTDNDIINWRRVGKGEQEIVGKGRRSLLPYRIYKIQVEKEEKYAASAKARVYRCFGDLSLVMRTKPNGDHFSDIIAGPPHWRQVLLQSLWGGLAPLSPHVNIPWEFTSVPVKGWGPLARAVRPGKKQGWAYHKGLGMSPQHFYWAAVMITENYITVDETGKEEERTYERPAILQLSRGQVLALAEKIDEKREDTPNFQFPGAPFTIYQEEKKKYKVRLLGGKPRYDMSEYVPPNINHEISAIVDGLEDFLVGHNSAIKGFPWPKSHEDDGWSSDTPYADSIYAKISGSSNGLDEFLPKNDGQSLDEIDPDEVKAAANDRFLRMSNKELREFLESLGQEVGPRAKREAMIEKIEALAAEESL